MEKAFGTLKSAFISTLILRLFNTFKKFVIEINTSNYTLNVILSQKGPDKKFHPIDFYSWKFTPAEINYKIHNKKVLVIIKALKKWHHYLKWAKYRIKVFINY